jgi:hypothetical protein
MVRDLEPYSLGGIAGETKAMKHIDKARFPLYNKEKEAYTCGTG